MAGGGSRVAGIVLAAGAATRFGGAKQLALLDGLPLLEHALAAMADAPVDFVVLVLGARAEEIRAAVDLHGASVVVADDWESGQSASLRVGVAFARSRGADAVVVTLGDQPRISADAIARVAAAEADAARATYDGVPAHPVLLREPLFDAVAALTGDTGARGLLRDAALVPCDGLGSSTDIDTHKDLADHA